MNLDIPVVLFCGGAGTRLREETEFRPKPLVAIGNRPILWHIMKIYGHYEFRKFIFCLGYKGELIKEYFFHYQMMNNDVTMRIGSNSGMTVHNTNNIDNWEIILSDTGEKSLKGARLKRVEKYIDTEKFMVTYGDGVADIDIDALMKFHDSHGKMATLTGVRPQFLRFGELNLRGNQITKFLEKPEYNGNYVNGGFFVFNREVFDYIEDENDFDLEVGLLDRLSSEGELMVYKHDGFWACMDTIRDTEYLNSLWYHGEALWKIW